MGEQRITKWKEVAELLQKGWRLDGDFDLVSPAGERRNAWGNAIKACRDRGLIPTVLPPGVIPVSSDEFDRLYPQYKREAKAGQSFQAWLKERDAHTSTDEYK